MLSFFAWWNEIYIFNTCILQVLDVSLKSGADEKAKNALTRVIVTRADVDIPKIKEEYKNKYGVHVTEAIEEKVNGNYKDFLLTLLARGDWLKKRTVFFSMFCFQIHLPFCVIVFYSACFSIMIIVLLYTFCNIFLSCVCYCFWTCFLTWSFFQLLKLLIEFV